MTTTFCYYKGLKYSALECKYFCLLLINIYY
jgi:hypothetical protein